MKRQWYEENEFGVRLTYRDLVERFATLYFAGITCVALGHCSHARLHFMTAELLADRLLEPGMRAKFTGSDG